MVQKKRVSIVACEGQHDIAFITRILHVEGYKTNRNKISSFPNPFDFFKKITASMIIADRKLGYQSPNFLLPSLALENDAGIIFLHNLNGGGRGNERKKLVTSYSELVGDDDFTKDLNYYFRFLFFFDADEGRVSQRLVNITDEFNLSSQLENGVVAPFLSHEIGCYVYHENGSDTGVLEDILLGYFSKKEPNLLHNVSSFLSDNELDIERTKELHIIDGTESRNGNSKSYLKKSKVNLFGQLQFSGMSNSVIISKSDFLRKSDIEICPQCILIKDMFN
ncbi:MAG: hypothetical protein EKE20_16655 [Candidatus Symbiopectobacterium sp. Dall1.0]|nr:hypothetical protein [Candidatus Symbiopectobacterium sp. Dall1.0]